MKSANQQVVADLIKLSEEAIENSNGLLCGIWNKEVLNIPDLSLALEEEAHQDESVSLFHLLILLI